MTFPLCLYGSRNRTPLQIQFSRIDSYLVKSPMDLRFQPKNGNFQQTLKNTWKWKRLRIFFKDNLRPSWSTVCRSSWGKSLSGKKNLYLLVSQIIQQTVSKSFSIPSVDNLLWSLFKYWPFQLHHAQRSVWKKSGIWIKNWAEIFAPLRSASRKKQVINSSYFCYSCCHKNRVNQSEAELLCLEIKIYTSS